ncbi:unnamed protein product [Ceratitis capitata]|uniref:(Mediterranean fruit fly) hypothetical protein n=1 Tax=Ceratitis capitata TaxID=7213 RepID=A0A811V5C5_CERCA|nr:unnamed protein product [Ceratitis capitata]
MHIWKYIFADMVDTQAINASPYERFVENTKKKRIDLKENCKYFRLKYLKLFPLPYKDRESAASSYERKWPCDKLSAGIRVWQTIVKSCPQSGNDHRLTLPRTKNGQDTYIPRWR